MPAPSRVLRHLHGLRTLLDARNSRDLGAPTLSADEQDGDGADDSGSNADDETSDVFCALCARTADGDWNSLDVAAGESDDGVDKGAAAWLARQWWIDADAVARVTTELTAEHQRCVSAPDMAGPAWIAERLDGLGVDLDMDVLRRWKSEVAGDGRCVSGGSDGDGESAGL
jgi:hypothetical protein